MTRDAGGRNQGPPTKPTAPGVRRWGGVPSLVLAWDQPLDVGRALNAGGIAGRAGHHGAQPILRRYGLEATVRPSFAIDHTFGEIDVLMTAVRRIAAGAAGVG